MEKNNVNEYLQELEKEYGISKTDPNKNVKTCVIPLYSRVSNLTHFRPNYGWKPKDRLKHMKEMFKSYWRHLNKYNPFDFKSYKEEYNPYGFDIYSKIYRTSTPWTRLKKFLQEIKNMFYYTIKAYYFTPSVIKHYQKNKKRITWFEENVWGWFFGSKKEKEKHKKKLQEFGYTVSKDGNSVEYKTIKE